jgi:hypothetical protein
MLQERDRLGWSQAHEFDVRKLGEEMLAHWIILLNYSCFHRWFVPHVLN